MKYKLYFDNDFLGDITDVEVDDFWHIGRLSPTNAIGSYRNVLNFLVNENEDIKPPPNAEDLVFGMHWFIVDDIGRRRSIDAPYLHPDNEIRWQWSEWELDHAKTAE